MQPVEVNLTVPVEIGASVFSMEIIRTELNRNHSLSLVSHSAYSFENRVLNDTPGMLMILQGVVLGVATIKSLFDLLKIVIVECCNVYRQHYRQKHELEILHLLIDRKDEAISLNDVSASINRLNEIEEALIRKTGN